jgi:hypothetical protein
MPAPEFQEAGAGSEGPSAALGLSQSEENVVSDQHVDAA